jgi:hypothetical protein
MALFLVLSFFALFPVTATCSHADDAISPDIITDQTQLHLKVGTNFLNFYGYYSGRWGGSLRDNHNLNSEWILKKCLSGTCETGRLGSADVWTSATSEASVIKTCDVVALYSVNQDRVKNCMWVTCTNQLYPLPQHHWGSVQKVLKAGVNECGVPLTSNDGIYFQRTWGNVFRVNYYLKATANNFGGTTDGTYSVFNAVNPAYVPASSTTTTSTTSTVTLCSPTVDPVNLGTAGEYAILTKAGISTVPSSIITGNIAVSPAAGTYMTGFSFTADASATFSTSSQITGSAFAPTDSVPTPATLTTAISDMEIAYTDASQRANTKDINISNGALGGLILTTGVYKFTVDVSILSSMTFSGCADAVFIIKTTGNLLQASGTTMILEGGVQAKNIFWQVAGAVQINTSASMKGIILGKTKVVFQTGASLDGRILAQTACTLDQARITEPTDNDVNGPLLL